MQHPGFALGLDLRDQVDIVNPAAAIDLLNVTFTERGGVRQRDGYGTFTASEGTNRYDSLLPYYTSSGTRQLVVGAGNRLEALSTAGAVVASSTSPTASPHFFTRFGGPGNEVVYAANGTDSVRQWNGSAWSTPSWVTTTPTGRFLAVTPWDNRLVNARRGGSTAGDNVSTVRFSTADSPLTFGANDYVDVTPGDGEQIMGMVSWRDFLFVFKESRFFVFYTTSVDSAGEPVFEYRTVDTGVGLCASRALVAGTDGVYFLSRNGVYRTTGGEPELISGALDPLFSGETSDFYRAGALNHSALTQPAMCWHQERLFLSVPLRSATTNSHVLVWDRQFKWWSLWDFPAAALGSFRVGAQPELVFALASGDKHVVRHSRSYTDDDGTAIQSRWASGWFDYKLGDQVKKVRQAKAWGKGVVAIGYGNDFVTSGGSSTVDFSSGLDTWGDGTGTDTWGDGTGTDTWGDGQAVAPKMVRGIAVQGTVFNVALSSVSGAPWTAYRLAAQLSARRAPGVVQVDK